MFVISIGSAEAQTPAIGPLLKAFQIASKTNPGPVVDILASADYQYRFHTQDGTSTLYVYSKNCKVLHEEYTNGIEKLTPTPESASSSIIEFGTEGEDDLVTYIRVHIYSASGFKAWVSQLKALGYRETDEGGCGARGRDWVYVASGKPSISIWNDYSNEYILNISNY